MSSKYYKISSIIILCSIILFFGCIYNLQNSELEISCIMLNFTDAYCTYDCSIKTNFDQNAIVVLKVLYYDQVEISDNEFQITGNEKEDVIFQIPNRGYPYKIWGFYYTEKGAFGSIGDYMEMPC